MSRFRLAIHGGAGALNPKLYNEKELRDYKRTLKISLEAGYKILEARGSAMDAVVASVLVLEDSPLFNAGKGAVFNAQGVNELDASLMDGKTEKAGGVSCVTRVKNPILAARKVMEVSPHVILAGDGASSFAEAQGLTIVENRYFYTEKRFKELEKAKKYNRMTLDHADDEVTGEVKRPESKSDQASPQADGQSDDKLSDRDPDPDYDPQAMGTVGAVALDRHGDLAAATSTGGLTNKLHGRVSDSSIVGAGTYARNKTCAVSGTGTGDYFIRGVSAHTVSVLMEYGGLSLADACRKVLQSIADKGGQGGFIAISQDGSIVLDFNSTGMFRGEVSEAKQYKIGIFESLETIQ